jgi:hypothetical protein
MESKFKVIRFSCGPNERIGSVSLRGSHGSASYYRVVNVEVFPRSDLPFTPREAIAEPISDDSVVFTDLLLNREMESR